MELIVVKLCGLYSKTDNRWIHVLTLHFSGYFWSFFSIFLFFYLILTLILISTF